MLQIRAFFYIMLVDRQYPLKQIKQTWKWLIQELVGKEMKKNWPE